MIIVPSTSIPILHLFHCFEVVLGTTGCSDARGVEAIRGGLESFKMNTREFIWLAEEACKYLSIISTVERTKVDKAAASSTRVVYKAVSDHLWFE